MLKAIGVLLNMGMVIYLGYLAYTSMTPDQIALDVTQNPFVLCFIAVIGLFITVTK